MSFIKKVFKEQNCVIACSSSEEYSPFLAVFLQSMVDNSSHLRLYDVVVLSRSISDYNKNLITKLIKRPNFSVRFYDPSILFLGSTFRSLNSYGVETYNRIAAPVVFADYEKIIFTDIDMIINHDILDIVDFDLENYAIAACKEPMWKFYVETNKKWKGSITTREYVTNTLKITDPYDYYNAGLIVFNVKLCCKLNSFNMILNLLNNNSYLFAEQCALNSFFYKKIKELPCIYNYFTSKIIFNDSNINNPLSIYKDYISHESQAYIYHFVHGKPWKDLSVRNANLWWDYANKTPYFSSSTFFSNTCDLISKNFSSCIYLESKIICLCFDNVLSAKFSVVSDSCVSICFVENGFNNEKKEISKDFLIRHFKYEFDEITDSYLILKTDLNKYLSFIVALSNDFIFESLIEKYNCSFIVSNVLPILPSRFNIKSSFFTNHPFFKSADEIFCVDLIFDPFIKIIKQFGFTVINEKIASNKLIVEQFYNFSIINKMIFRIVSNNTINFYFVNKSLSCDVIKNYLIAIEKIISLV